MNLLQFIKFLDYPFTVEACENNTFYYFFFFF